MASLLDLVEKLKKSIGQGVQTVQQNAPRVMQSYANTYSKVAPFVPFAPQVTTPQQVQRNYRNTFFAIPNAQTSIQNFAQRNPGIANTLLKTEPFVNRVTSFMQQPYKPVSLPSAQTRSPVANVGYNFLVKPVAEGLINFPSNYIGGISKTGLDIGKMSNGEKVPARKLLGDIGQTGGAIMDASVLPFGAGAMKNVAQNVGRNTLKTSMIHGGVEGLKYGGVYGLLSALKNNQDVENLSKYTKNVLGETAQGGIAGGVFGGAAGGLSYGAGKLFNSLAGAYKKAFPKASDQEAAQAAKGFIRDELGRFSRQEMPKKEPQFYGDMRESLGLSRNGEGMPSIGMTTRIKGGSEAMAKAEAAKTPSPTQNFNEMLKKQGFTDAQIQDRINKAGEIGKNITAPKDLAKKRLPGILFTTSKTKAEGKVKISNPRETIGRISDTIQGESGSIPNQQPLLSGEVLPESNLQGSSLPPSVAPPKSGVNKIGTPPEQSKPEGIINNVKNYVDQLYIQAVDRFHPLSKVAKQAGEDQIMRNALTQHYGAGSTATYHVDYELAPIIKRTNVDDLRSLTIAQRDIELARRGIKGSDETAGQAVINQLKNKYGNNFSQLEGSAKKLYEYQDALVKKYLVDSGVISKESYDAMKAKNQFYVPFKRVMDQVDTFLGATPQRANMGSVSSQNVIKGIKGSERQIIDPLQSIVENTYKIVSLGQRNKVARTIASLGEKLPGVIRPFEGEVGNRKDLISVLENGKTVRYQVPPDVAEAAKGLNEESLNSIIKILSVPSKLVRATATGLNPEFLLPNVVRDLQSAFVNTGLNPLRFISGISHLVKRDEVYQDFLRSGGKTSSIIMDRPFLKTTVGEMTGKPGIEALNPMRLLQTLGEWSEQPTRIGIFEQTKSKLIKQGLSVAEAEVRAANAAQEGTVNFSRSGSKMKAANALITFLNARLQGVDQLLRTAKRDPAGTMFRLGLITQVPAVLSYLYNRNFQSYNDERVVSKYDKQNNFILMLSDKPIPQLGGAQFIKIPKGDVGRFANPTESFLSYLDGKGENKVIQEIAAAFGGLSPFQNVGDIIPAAIKPPIEYAANRSFFTGQPLVPDYKASLPAKYQYTSQTQPLYKIIGDKFNISPAKLENTTSGYLTGFEKLGNFAFNAVTGQKPQGQAGADINRTPIARRFMGGEKRTSEEQTLIDEKKAKSIDFQINDVKSAIKRGDVPMNEGQKQINQLRQQQQDIINKVSSGGTSSTGGKNTIMFTLDGKLKEVDLNFQPTTPKLTGNTELDKKLISKFNGEVTSKANDIRDLYEAGKITADDAEKQLTELINKKISTSKAKKPKKITIKNIKMPKVKLAKASKKFKFRAVKMPKIKISKIKTPKIKLTKS